MTSSVNDNLKMLFNKMEDFVSTKTVVGEAVHIGDVILIPLVDVSFGMATGLSGSREDGKATGHDGSKEDGKGKDIGAGGVGAKMSPSAIVVIINGTVQLVNVKSQDSVNKMIDMIPGIMSKVGLDSIFDKFTFKKDTKSEENFEGKPEPSMKIVVADEDDGVL